VAVTTLRINFTTRTARKNRPVEAETFTDTVEEIAADFQSIQTQWNNELQPLLNTLPSGGSGDGTDTLDAFEDGLDGSRLYVDADISDDSARYYNTSRSRPNTVKEQLAALYTYTESVRDSLRSEMTTTTISGALTSAQKTRIGNNIFDSTKTSTNTSLDGLTASNQSNISQLAKDLYGSVFTLNGDGVAILDNDVQTAINAAVGFTGMSAWNDSSPAYISTQYISDGDSLETATGKLDAQLATACSCLVALPASDVTIADSGGYLVAGNVEAALAEIVGGGYNFNANIGIGQENGSTPQGTLEVFTSSGLFASVASAALPTTNDTSLLISGEEGIVELFGGRSGVDCCWFSFGELNGLGTLVDKWTFSRQTTNSGDGRLELIYGVSANPSDNSTYMTFETDGNIIAWDSMTVSGVFTTWDRPVINHSGLIHNDLYVQRASVDVADDNEISLPADTAGWGFVQAEDNEEYAQFSWTVNATVTLIYNSTNVVNTDTDTNLCIYDAGNYVSIKNRLGGTKTIRYEIHFSE
jgi:hypothetical protein